jgi:hypothetical protein
LASTPAAPAIATATRMTSPRTMIMAHSNPFTL